MPEKWRLSFVRLDYEFVAGKGGQTKITPDKRYSYLVEENEPCATAYRQLFPIFENDSDAITLDNLEEAFSVERVIKDFFDRYAEKFYQLKEYLENNPEFKAESQGHRFSTNNLLKNFWSKSSSCISCRKKDGSAPKSIPIGVPARPISCEKFFKTMPPPEKIFSTKC